MVIGSYGKSFMVGLIPGQNWLNLPKKKTENLVSSAWLKESILLSISFLQPALEVTIIQRKTTTFCTVINHHLSKKQPTFEAKAITILSKDKSESAGSLDHWTWKEWHNSRLFTPDDQLSLMAERSTKERSMKRKCRNWANRGSTLEKGKWAGEE